MGHEKEKPRSNNLKKMIILSEMAWNEFFSAFT